ncbi:hypothetical protein VCSRO11_3497 [Vibrio cholerae]|nr:hypothetical protein [Vibrio cholerae]BCN19317.1 hypothetical protein [Vibrio cholerae]GHX71772.1 hypothetical protein VCSRO11_3497 [Vibrio cholerae]GIB93464.1 hypothetical protein VCSRO190_2755 [Vibrio cholerae]
MQSAMQIGSLIKILSKPLNDVDNQGSYEKAYILEIMMISSIK